MVDAWLAYDWGRGWLVGRRVATCRDHPWSGADDQSSGTARVTAVDTAACAGHGGGRGGRGRSGGTGRMLGRAGQDGAQPESQPGHFGGGAGAGATQGVPGVGDPGQLVPAVARGGGGRQPRGVQRSASTVLLPGTAARPSPGHLP